MRRRRRTEAPAEAEKVGVAWVVAAREEVDPAGAVAVEVATVMAVAVEVDPAGAVAVEVATAVAAREAGREVALPRTTCAYSR